MNWIRLQSEYFRHRKTLRLVRRLGEIAELYPVKLWTWAVEQSPDGSLRDIDAAELACICGFKGSDPAELWAAMLDCGFVEVIDGKAWIRSWAEHQGKLIDRAERNAERMREARENQKRQAEIAAAPSAKANAVPLPANLNTQEFRAAWEDWHAYRRERRLSKWTEKTVQTQLAKMSKAGPAASIEAIRESISNGWQGVFPGKVGAAAKSHPSPWLAPEVLQAGGKRDERPPESVATRLGRLAASLPDSLPSVGRWRREIEALKGEASEVEGVLRGMDARLISSLWASANSSAVAAEIDATVAKASVQFRQRMNADDAREAEANLRAQQIRERFGVPRLSIFSDEAREAA